MRFQHLSFSFVLIRCLLLLDACHLIGTLTFTKSIKPLPTVVNKALFWRPSPLNY
uniref:DNA binding protein n=1 Tax=Rhizophora mucronata TaxID=61149 RepID=A0A2P2LZS0_RHIMU